MYDYIFRFYPFNSLITMFITYESFIEGDKCDPKICLSFSAILFNIIVVIRSKWHNLIKFPVSSCHDIKSKKSSAVVSLVPNIVLKRRKGF